MACTMRPTPEEDPDIRTDSPVEDHHRQDDDIPATERGMEEASVLSRNEEPMASANEDPMASTSEDLVPRRQRKSRKRKASLPPSPDLISLANKILLLQTQAKRDSFATFAGERLQRLDDRQSAHAERVMFETLNKAAAGFEKCVVIVHISSLKWIPMESAPNCALSNSKGCKKFFREKLIKNALKTLQNQVRKYLRKQKASTLISKEEKFSEAVSTLKTLLFDRLKNPVCI
ncbi:uncharacterized protein [Phyllobates terribilis]|uniref:uncharacterized protein n=1 Tax=Phyllobates terribilis TaxID=111132 RepID=UPI003CCAC890